MADLTSQTESTPNRWAVIAYRCPTPQELNSISKWYSESLEQKVSVSALQRSLNEARDHLIVAVQGMVVCGFAHTVWSGGPSELLGLVVAKSHRRLGVASGLIDQLVSVLTTASSSELWLEVRADNDAAIALYLETGARKTGIRRRYYRDGTDAVLMSYSLGGGA